MTHDDQYPAKTSGSSTSATSRSLLATTKQTTIVIIDENDVIDTDTTATSNPTRPDTSTPTRPGTSTTNPMRPDTSTANPIRPPGTSNPTSVPKEEAQQAQPPLQPAPLQAPSPLVNLVLTEAALLSGGLEDCFTSEDESCEAGVAAVSAFARHLAFPLGPTLVFPKFEKQSQFVQVHPLGWSVNRLIMQGLLGWKVLMSTPSLLLSNSRDNFGSQRDLTYLQSSQFPFLITNVEIPPSISWGGSSNYHEYVHYDEETQIALLSIANSGEPLNHDQVQSAWGALHSIADRNLEAGCLSLTPDEQEQQALFESYQEVYMDGSTAFNNNNKRCWIPVVVFDDGVAGKLQQFIDGIMKHPHPPLFIVDVDKSAADVYPEPTLVHVPVPIMGEDGGNSTTAMGSNTNATITKPVWVHSFGRKDDIYYQHELHVDWNIKPPSLLNVTLLEQEMEVVPEAYRDDLYSQHILYLRQQADLALANNPQVGYSTEFPVARDGEYRRCQGGECEVGNLFTDAIRWKAKAHVAFVTAGGLRGDGWPAGPVYASNIWSSLPFPNSLCTGTMSGISLFQMLDYSIAISAFEGFDTDDGDRLLQISGMNVVYNTQIPRGSSRILSIDVWDPEVKEWLPIDRLGLYKFATDSYLCSAYDPYPDFLGANGNYTLDGEIPGSIGDELVQYVVGEYLGQLDGPYDGSIQGRLVNNTDNFDVLNLIQTEESCLANHYWSERRGACFPCPDSTHVSFSDERLEFEGQRTVDGGIISLEDELSPFMTSSFNNATSLFLQNSTDSNTTANVDPTLFENVLRGRILLVNRELTNFSVVPKAIPSWLKFLDDDGAHLSERFVLGGPTTALPSGSSLALNFIVGNDDSINSGTALGTVSFGILGRSVEGDLGIRSCDDYSRDATFDVFLSITPPEEMNELGALRYVGIVLMCIALMSSVFFGYCLYKYRATAILKTMQPLFLVTVCAGVFMMALTILPLSLDDGVLSDAGADASCMATPWLLSMGLVIIFSALFSKLWRINQLFNVASFRRMKVTERDVMAPFFVLFTLNTALLIAWNVVDPLRSERYAVEGEEWKTYAACRSDGIGYVFLYTIAAIDCVALLMACYQAYQARNISEEFAESKSVGMAVGCWLQVLLVGLPAQWLVDPEDIVATYFLQTGLLFVLCMSMMLIIFGPLLMMVFQYKRNPGSFNGGGRSRMSNQVSGLGTECDRNSSHSGYNGYSARARPSFMTKVSSNRHSFAGHDDKTFKDMVALVAAKESGSGAMSGSGRSHPSAALNGSGRHSGALTDSRNNGSASSLGDSWTKRSAQAQPETFTDEETGAKEELNMPQTKRVSDILEESESQFSSTYSLGISRPASKDPLLDDLSASIASITCPEQEVTQQMLLNDLLPRKAAENFLHESDSSVPFSSGDFLLDNLLSEDDSDDSSVPFQGSSAMLSMGDNGDDDGGDDSSTEGDSGVALDESATSAMDMGVSNYSQQLLERSSLPQQESGASPTQPTVPQDQQGAPLLTTDDVVIATIEKGTATKTDEIPFSSRFVDYKKRLNSLRSEDGTLSTADCRTRLESPDSTASESSPDVLVGPVVSTGTKMKDKSDRSAVDRRGSFQMMNEYIVQSMREVSDHDVPNSKKSRKKKAAARAMMDRSFNTGSSSRRTMGNRSEGGLISRLSGNSSSRKLMDYSDSNLTERRKGGSQQRRKAPGDFSRRSTDHESDDNFDDEEDERYPWEKDATSNASAMLGYDLPDEWQDVAGGNISPKKKKGLIKSTVSKLNQSLSAFQFSGEDADAATPVGGKKPKLKNPFAKLSLSVPALNYTPSVDEDSDSNDSGNGRKKDATSLELYVDEYKKRSRELSLAISETSS